MIIVITVVVIVTILVMLGGSGPSTVKKAAKVTKEACGLGAEIVKGTILGGATVAKEASYLFKKRAPSTLSNKEFREFLEFLEWRKSQQGGAKDKN